MKFDVLDVAQLPPPDAVEVLDFDTAFADWMARFVAEAQAAGLPYDVETLRSDPIGWVMRVAAYRGDVVLRQRVNDAVKAVLLATATGADLDNVAADLRVVRMEGEADEDLRLRRALAPEAFTTCGTSAAYRFHAGRAHPDVDVHGTAVYGAEYAFVPEGQVHVVVQSKNGSGAPSRQVLLAVATLLRAWDAPEIAGYARPTPQQLDDDKLRPDTDHVVVRGASVTEYAVRGVLTAPPGPSAETLRLEAEKRIRAYGEAQRRVGRKHTLDSLIAAGRLMGADGASPALGFRLVTPVATVDPGPYGVAHQGVVTVDLEIDGG